MTQAEVLNFAKKNGVRLVDFKFVDLLGQWQHTTMPIHNLREDSFLEGFNFDGSSSRGWKAINESDMTFVPDAATAVIDPFIKAPTLSLIADIADAVTHQPYARDPRQIAKKAEQYLKQTGLGDISYFGPEPEFFIFDSVRFNEGPNTSFYKIDSKEDRWNSGAEEEGGNLGYKPDFKRGYFPVSPIDTQTNIRAEMALPADKCGKGPPQAVGFFSRPGWNSAKLSFNQVLDPLHKC